MIPDFSHNVRIRLAQLEKKMLHPDDAKALPCWLSQFSFSKLRQPTGQRVSNVRMQQTKISIRPILFLYYQETLVPSNLNSKQLWFHGAHPIYCTCLNIFLYNSLASTWREYLKLICLIKLSLIGLWHSRIRAINKSS